MRRSWPNVFRWVREKGVDGWKGPRVHQLLGSAGVCVEHNVLAQHALCIDALRSTYRRDVLLEWVSEETDELEAAASRYASSPNETNLQLLLDEGADVTNVECAAHIGSRQLASRLYNALGLDVCRYAIARNCVLKHAARQAGYRNAVGHYCTALPNGERALHIPFDGYMRACTIPLRQGSPLVAGGREIVGTVVYNATSGNTAWRRFDGYRRASHHHYLAKYEQPNIWAIRVCHARAAVDQGAVFFTCIDGRKVKTLIKLLDRPVVAIDAASKFQIQRLKCAPTRGDERTVWTHEHVSFCYDRALAPRCYEPDEQQ